VIKIIHVLSDTNIGGAGQLLLNQLKHFDKDKFLIKVVLPKDSLLKPKIEKLGYEVIETQNGADKSLDFAAIPEFIRIFKREKPNIVHCHSSLSARIAAWLKRVKMRIFTKHCTKGSGKLHGILGNILSTHIIATDYASKEALLKSGLNPKKITVIINGSEPLRKLSDDEKRAARQELGIADNDFVFGIIGRLAPIKGQKYFIEAAKIISEKHKSCKFLIAGIGNGEQALKQQAKDMDNVIFPGFLNDIAPTMNIIDVNVNCSDSETSCLALSEGFSVGKPAIATVGGGNPYMVTDGENGLLVPIRDAAAIADKMEKLMKNKDLLDKMSQTAEKHYLEKFTAETMTRQVEDIYKGEENYEA
jgi:glycosyltransferase involved in cell wall biosynthesis